MNNSSSIAQGAQPGGVHRQNSEDNDNMGIEVLSERYRHHNQVPKQIACSQNERDRLIKPFSIESASRGVAARQSGPIYDHNRVNGLSPTEKVQRVVSMPNGVDVQCRHSGSSSHTSMDSAELKVGEGVHPTHTFGNMALKKHLNQPRKPKFE